MNEPIPHLDPAPPANPGGVDAVPESPEDLPPVIPDPPFSAQLDGDVVPDAVTEPDDKEQEGRASEADDNPPTADDPA